MPKRIFDAHLHCGDEAFCLSKPGDEPPEYKTTEVLGMEKYDRHDIAETFARLFPGREVHYLLFGWVYRGNDFDAHNAFTAAKVAAEVEKYGFRGLKPYRFWTQDEVNFRITDMVPEPLLEVADEKRLLIMMHIGKAMGIAGEENVRDLLRLSSRYPNIRWDLAHMARASVAWPLERTIERIKDIPNFCYDFSSAACSDVFTLAFRHLPLDRIMFGTDFPCDLIKGNMLSFGYGWELVTQDHLDQMQITHCDRRATFAHYETLRAFKRTADFESFGSREIEQIFYDNGVKFVFG